ncbi:MAG: phosphatidylglycerophosphatase A [Fibrobacter sp.]|nr:phosphatidylglycerophosphatase A [Fibrobacter sp.]
MHKFEKFPRAWGVMADDLLGGIYAGILVAALAAILPF